MRINLQIAALLGAIIISSQAVADNRLIGTDSDSLRTQLSRPVEQNVEIPASANLNFYLKLAAKRSPALRAAYNDWIAAVEKSNYAGSLPDPMLSFGYFVEHVETRVGPQEQRYGIKQAFPWFGTLGAKKDVATEMANAMYRKFEAEWLRLNYQVKSAYYDYYFIGRDLQITRDNFELLTFWESVARTKYKVGLQRHPDVIKAQVELGKLEDQLATLEQSLKPTAAKLRALTYLPDTLTLPLPDTIYVSEDSLPDDSVLAAVLENNPNLQAVSHLVEKEEAGRRLASKQAYPSFSLGVDYIQTGPAQSPDMAESGKDPWMVGVGLSLPIWLGKNSARRHEAEARLRSAQYDLQDKREQLRAYTEQVLFEYGDARRKTGLYRDGLVPKAEQALNAGYSAYQAGEADFLSLLDAQRQLLAFQLTVEREKVRLAKRAAELEMLSGQELQNYKR